MDCVDALWRRNNECGLDGVDCRPFSNASFAFRCPADCSSVRPPNPHYVGPQNVEDRPFVVGGGGGGPYRGDSFLCSAAIHAGVIEDTTGGCGLATLVGEYYQYFSSSQHGIDSIPFDSYFPLSFTVAADSTTKCAAPGLRYSPFLPLSLLFTVLLSLFTSSPSLLFFATFTGIFTHTALVADPPNPTTTLLPTLLSRYAGCLLPALTTAALLYLTTARRSLAGLPASANFEKTMLWLLPFWLGACADRTLEPVLLAIRHLAFAPGAGAGAGATIFSFIIVSAMVAAALAVAYLQARTLRDEGRLPKYLAFYLVSGVALVLLAAAPDPRLRLRLHGYILALLLLPGTAAQTRVSLVVQGLLLGVFVNGVARGGFEGLLQVQTEGILAGERLLPEVVAPLIERLSVAAAAAAAIGATTTTGGVATGTGTGSGGGGGGGGGGMRISFKWRAPAPALLLAGGRDGRPPQGISVLVNDVERYKGWFAERPLEEQVFAWTRRADSGVVADEYFRFGFVTDGGRALDYTEAGTWFVNGSWSQGAGYW